MTDLTQHHSRPIELIVGDMITESMTIQGLHVVSLMLTPCEWWEAARCPFNTASAAEVWLTIFAVVALIISLILVFWLITNYRRYERRSEEKLAELTATNEKLRQEIAELKLEQIEVLENIIDAKPPRKKVLGLNPQEIKAVSELGKRLGLF